ncbi:NAD(P)H-binding protein [Pedobacter sp. Hv1]|uniref:NAD(P)H-binding protein n=1 Tax=Pedobacter sp. Hv1 TaxID=1740090 RepID=UPI0006D8BF15|nr:NAD(P)H-binding protein [Pedobacter sp. Hv1]KQC01731.1 NAD-dependent dehydratase [Pedobacter sp. Hv1]
MKIILTGSLGNISRPLAINLISQGHQVTVISSNNEKSAEITNLGAVPAIGSVSDEDFLTTTFKGSDLVYLMVPNDLTASDLKAHIKKTGEHYVNAIQKANIKKVVLLSSIGAHLDAGTGPIAGLAAVEKLFRKLSDIDILFLRPAYFYNNLYGNIDMIKHMGIIGGNYGAAQEIVLVDPQDIASIATDKINEGFNGHQTFYIASDRRTLKEVAEQLGQAIGKPELPWIEFDDTQSFDGMLQAGLSEDMARNYVEMGNAVKSAILWEDFDLNKAVPQGKTKLEDFALKFAAAYNG